MFNEIDKEINHEALLKVVKEMEEKEKVRKTLTELFKLASKQIGTILALMGSIVYLVTIIVLVMGADDLKLEIFGKDGLFFAIGFIFGMMIHISLTYQGMIYAREENDVILTEYYNLIVKDKKEKRVQSFEFKYAVDLVLTAFSKIFIFIITGVGIIMLAGFDGMGHAIYIINAMGNLCMFIGFGLMGLSKTYYKYIKLKIPVIKERIRIIKEKKEL